MPALPLASGALRLRSPTSVAVLLGAANVGVSLCQWQAGISVLEPTASQLVDWGGDLAPLTLNGQPWRLLTGMFIHVGALHLVTNMLMLAMVARMACLRYGAFGFGAVYLLGGLLASVVSAWWASCHLGSPVPGPRATDAGLHLTVSVGASGAIMAVCGALVAVWAGTAGRHPDSVHDRDFHRGLLETIGFNLVLGLATPGIDQSAHMGGLAAGFLLGSLIGVQRPGQPSWVRCGRAALAVTAALAMTSQAMKSANTAALQTAAARIQSQGQPGASTMKR